MIVQTAEAGTPHFVIRQVDHGRMCGQMARAFGNERFTPLEPRELMEFVTEYHDEGWRAFDDAPLRDPKTGLPHTLGTAPVPSLVALGHGSPGFNEAHHPFCGLLSAMHYWGVYHDRYGIMPKSLMGSPQGRPPILAMLASEQERIERLTAALAADPATAGLVAEPSLMDNYKRLQFFDMLALYFNLRHEGERGEKVFDFVPAAPGQTEAVRVQPVEPGVYRLSPYPFRAARMLLDCDGRYLAPVSEGEDVAAHLRAAPVVQQTFMLVAG